MAKKRKFVAYRNVERPYTRYSKFRKKSFIRTRPNKRVVRFDMGTDHKQFSHYIDLKAGTTLQIRDNAMESARQTCNRLLERTLTKTGYKLKILMYPHHVLRENPLASGAGADRMSTGMSHSFGKIIGIAAQIKEGQPLMRVWVNAEHLATGRKALKRAQQKFPCNCKIEVTELEKPSKPHAPKTTSAAKRAEACNSL